MVDTIDILDTNEFARFVQRQHQPAVAIPTRLPTWNSFCDGDGGLVGLALGWHVMVAAATNMGKTAFMLNLAADIVDAGWNAQIFTEEMAPHTLQHRMYPLLSGVNSRALTRGNVDEDGVLKMGEALEAVEAKHIVAPSLRVNKLPVRDILKVVESMRDSFDRGTRVFLVDYIQLLGGTQNDSELRERCAEISYHLFNFAHTHEALTIALSQVNREASKDKKAPPIIESMIGSSSIENDADMGMLLDHSKYEKDGLDRWKHRTWAILGKNRHGQKGAIPIEWDWRTFRCREALPDEESKWPK